MYTKHSVVNDRLIETREKWSEKQKQLNLSTRVIFYIQVLSGDFVRQIYTVQQIKQTAWQITNAASAAKNAQIKTDRPLQNCVWLQHTYKLSLNTATTAYGHEKQCKISVWDLNATRLGGQTTTNTGIYRTWKIYAIVYNYSVKKLQRGKMLSN